MNTNLPQKVEAQIRYGLLTWVSKMPVKVILVQGFAIIGIFIAAGFLLAFSVKPRVIVMKQYFTKTDSFFGVDTFNNFKAILIDKSWGKKSNMMKPNLVPTNKKFTKVVTSKRKGYSVYEKRIWMLKTDESFRKEAYEDGKFYSIAFGFNMNDVNHKLLKRLGKLHLIEGKWNSPQARVTWENGIELTQIYIDHNINPGLKLLEKQRGERYTDDQLVALACKAYNSGNFTLGKCCGAKSRCGASKKSTRTVHNARRNFEWRLYNGQVTSQEWEKIRLKAIKVESDHK